jgi:hypothetical protein
MDYFLDKYHSDDRTEILIKFFKEKNIIDFSIPVMKQVYFYEMSRDKKFITMILRIV